jgi:hypothetical protein
LLLLQKIVSFGHLLLNPALGRKTPIASVCKFGQPLLLLQKIVSFGHLLLNPALGRKTPIASVCKFGQPLFAPKNTII